MNRMSRCGGIAGFTLLELMVVLVLVAISLSVVTPLLQGLLHNNRVNYETNRFLGAINLARSEAIIRNVTVSVCPSAMTRTGESICSGTYAGGWIVFSNPDKDRVVDAGTDKVLRVFEGLPSGYHLTNRKGTRAAFKLINYLPDGSSHSNRTLVFCPPQQVSVQSLSIVINIVGRARLARDWGTCPVV